MKMKTTMFPSNPDGNKDDDEKGEKRVRLLDWVVRPGLSEEDTETVRRQKYILVTTVLGMLCIGLGAIFISRTRVRYMLILYVGSSGVALGHYYRTRSHHVLRWYGAFLALTYPVGSWLINGCEHGWSGTGIHLWGFVAPILNILTGGSKMGHYFLFFTNQLLVMAVISLRAFGPRQASALTFCPVETLPSVFETAYASTLVDHTIPTLAMFFGFIEFVHRVEASNERLLKAKREVEESANARLQFLATMSHEIRTPLNGITGALNLFSTTPLTADQQSCISIIAVSSSHLLLLLNDILDFAKLDSGGVVLEKCEMDLERETNDVLKIMQSAASAKGLDLALYYEPTLPRVVIGDPLRLKQILFNLISNAVKFTSRGFVMVEVVVSHDDEGRQHNRGPWSTTMPLFDDNQGFTELDSDASYINISPTRVKIVISDTGIGIPRDKLPLLFNRFQQVDSSTTRKYGGTGLGLAITKQLVFLMDGTIAVDSELEQGTKFFVTIPFPNAKSRRTSGHSPPGIRPAQPPSPCPPVDKALRQPQTVSVLVYQCSSSSSCWEPRPQANMAPPFMRTSAFDLTPLLNPTNPVNRTTSSLEATSKIILRYCHDWGIPCTSRAIDVTATGATLGTCPEGDWEHLHLIIPVWMVLKDQTKDWLVSEIVKMRSSSGRHVGLLLVVADREASRDAIVDRFSPLLRPMGVEFLPMKREHLHSLLLAPAEAMYSIERESTAPVDGDDAGRSNLGPGGPSNVQLGKLIQGDRGLLVAEDNNINQQVLSRMLDAEVVSHVIVETGLQAVEEYQTNRENWVLILMDLSMPEMDGYEATRLIREYEHKHKLPRVPIVALTAHAFADDKTRCVEVGFDEYLTKPYTKGALFDVLRQLIVPKLGCKTRSALTTTERSSGGKASEGFPRPPRAASGAPEDTSEPAT